MLYKIKGKNITVNNDLIQKYKETFYGLEPIEHAICRVTPDETDKSWQNSSDSDLSRKVSVAIQAEINLMGG